MEPLDVDLDEGELELPAEPMHLNMGPSHPAMHGTIRIVLELSGETIVKADVQVGICTVGSRRCASAAPGRRCSRTSTGSTTCRRC
jgi:NADH:ubiquinone oxidoreductase subunit D